MRRFPVQLFEGILPLDRPRIPVDVLGGVTLAALAIPETMGYTKIAGMPVITGLYTILLPIAVFAIFGSSRHLVVGADSASAAILAAGLAGMAATGSSQYVALAGLVALLSALYLIIARLVHLGFLADFLSRTVLVGFLTGVGIQVAAGQVGGMFGVPEGTGGTLRKLWGTLQNLGDTSWWTLGVSVVVAVVILGTKYVEKVIPGALIAVVGSIIVSKWLDLEADGVAVLGPVPGGLPSFGLPDVDWTTDAPALAATAFSIFIVILAQSAATSRAYAAKYGDRRFDENVDLVGLGMANVAAGRVGHVRRQRQPHQDADGGRRRRPQPDRVAHLRRRRADRAAVPDEAAAVHARGGALDGRVPDRHRADRREGHAPHLPAPRRRVRRRRDHRRGRRRRRRRAGHPARDRALDRRPSAARLQADGHARRSRRGGRARRTSRSRAALRPHRGSPSTASVRASTTRTRTSSARRCTASSPPRSRR